MNICNRVREGTRSRVFQSYAAQSRDWPTVWRYRVPAAPGRFRQSSLAAAGTEDATSLSFSSGVAISNVTHRSICELSRSACIVGNRNTELKIRLRWLWQRLQGWVAAAARLLAVALVLCLASLLPLPARVNAASTPGTCVVLDPAATAAESRKPSRRMHPAAAVPVADLAAASTAVFASAQLASSTGRPTVPIAGTISRQGYGRATSIATDVATQEDCLNSAAANSGSGTCTTSITTTIGGGSCGGSSAASSQATAAQAVDGGLRGDLETAALAEQLGVGLGEARAIQLFERHRASVVNISGMRAMQTFTTLDLGKLPFGQGSGFLWGGKGHVVTCYHLVKGAAEVKVTLSDNTSYTAKVLGYDAAKDVAVLKLSVPKSKLRELQPVTLGSAAGLRVGQTVYGIGNPWGLGHTLSQGPVCGLGLELSCGLFPIKGVLLVDCAADPGGSGGPLLDSRGSLMGLMVTPPSSSGGGGGGGTGRTFVVPIDAIRGLITQILAYGRTVRPALGITMAPAQVLERVGLEGVLVLEVPPGSPAHAAGLRPTHRDIFGDLVLGDVIVGLDGKAVRAAPDVYDILDEHRVGDRIKLDVLRDGKQTGLTVTLGERLLGAVEE